MGNLALSADGVIKLYNVNNKILDNFDDLLDEFYNWKKTSCYDEQLFVKFLQNKFGTTAVQFVKNLGWDIPKEYENVRWYNF